MYYNLVRKTPYKWLNLEALSAELFPQYEIEAIKYFTAIVKSRPHDPQASIRQGIYLRALETIPNLKVVKGRFVVRTKPFPIFPLSYLYPDLLNGLPLPVKVVHTEEKQSDVNLATHLLADCFEDKFDIGIIVSNDADLKLAVEVVVKNCGKQIGIVNPQRRNYRYVHGDLAKWATLKIHKINTSALKKCQFPPQLRDARGIFVKPQPW